MAIKDFFVGVGTCCLLLTGFALFNQQWTPHQKPDLHAVDANKIKKRFPVHLKKNPLFHKKMAEIAAQDPELKELKLQADSGSNPEVLAQLGHAYFDRKKYAQAIDMYHLVLKEHPQQAMILTDMGTAYFYLGMPHLALEKYLKAIQIAPETKDAYFNSGFVYVTLNQNEKAKEVWRQAKNLNDSDKAFKNRVNHLIQELDSVLKE